MKIGIISDIHGNHQALKVVLNEAKRLDVSVLLVLGDIIGYYYHCNEVLDMLANWPTYMIKGNHELMFEQSLVNENFANNLIKKYGSSFEIAKKNLSKLQIDFLLSLPECVVFKINSLSFMLCHGSPWSIYEYVYPNSGVEIFDRCIECFSGDFILMGHTHYSMVKNYKNCCLINPGSVGQLRSRGGVASWVVLDTNNKTALIQENAYDINDLVSEVKIVDKHIPYLWSVLERNI